MYILDTSNYRVINWTSGDPRGHLVLGGNGAGSTPERLNNPWGIFVGVNGSIFIADRNNHRIELWTAGKRNSFNIFSLYSIQ